MSITLLLHPNYRLGIEHYAPLRVRLIIYKSGEVYVCRKESIYKLKQFLALGEGRAFKGRLQLVKHGDVIDVEVKGKAVGSVGFVEMEKLLVVEPDSYRE